jgi:hypothetical protein
VGTFLLPGEGDLTVELNAWHTDARGPAPSGYVSDPDPTTYPHNAWAFDVNRGTVFPPNPEHVLQRNDYVIVTGTLWQDVAHFSADPNPLRECVDTALAGQGGWLEIHPVDTVRWVHPPPELRKNAVVVPLCARPGLFDVVDEVITPDKPTPPGPNSILKFQEIVDPRFTTFPLAEKQIGLDPCDPTKLKVNMRVQSPFSGGFVYYKSVGHLEKFFSPSRYESDSLTAMGHGRIERASHGADGLFRC